MDRLSDRLKELRQKRHFTQTQIAKLVNVTKAAVSSWESDMRQPPYMTLMLLADIYHVTTDYLLGRSSKQLIDVSGLSDDDISLICALVDSLKKKGNYQGK